MRRTSCAALALALAAAAGCGTYRPQGIAQYYARDYACAENLYAAGIKSEPESRALYLLLQGNLLLDRGDVAGARDSFIEATQTMESFAASGEAAAIVGQESAKEYKGDPYERMMAQWYLGLTDYMMGDYDKALPDFKSAALADGGVSDERYNSDASSVFLMMAKTYQALGDEGKAREEYDEAAGVDIYRESVETVLAAVGEATDEIAGEAEPVAAVEVAGEFLSASAPGAARGSSDPSVILHAAADEAAARVDEAERSNSAALGGQDGQVVSGYIREIEESAGRRLSGRRPAADRPLVEVARRLADGSNNLFVIAAVGRGPVKVNAGAYGQAVTFARPDYPERRAIVYIDGVRVGPTITVEDVYYQAVTRGGRAMDAVLAGKAIFKGALELAAADAFYDAGRAKRGKRRDKIVEGLVLLAVSSAVRAEADVRAWETLPDALQMLSARVDEGSHTVEVRFEGAHGNIPAMTRRWEGVDFAPGRENVLYIRAGQGAAWASPPNR